MTHPHPAARFRPPGLVLLLLLLAPAASLHAQDPTLPEREIPRVEAGVTVDGALTEPVWEQALALTGFWQYLPADGRPATDSTEVLAWYSPTAIHFGIRARATPGAVRATLADRDKIQENDYVLLLLDTFDDRRQAFVFGANPLGVQADGILRDAATRVGSFNMEGAAGAYQVDLSPDFVYESKGRVSEDGYEIEVRIPFKSLRYQTTDVQRWGFNVIRKVQSSGHELTWTPVRQANASFLAQSGRLTGLADLRRGLVLDLTPEITSSLNGRPAPDEAWRYERGAPQLGGNVRWGVTNNLTLNGTLNPDFSQVEADAAQLQYDPRSSLFFPEKRPFFLDGIEYFAMPNQLVYTRRLSDPTGAVKLTGKVSGTNLAVLSAVDAPFTSRTGLDHRYFNIVRVRRDLGGQSTLGAAYTDKMDGRDFNRVASADGRLVFRERYTFTFQGAASATRAGDFRAVAPLWDAGLSRSGRSFGFSYRLRGLHPDFRAESGFLDRVNLVSMTAVPRFTRFGREGGLIESWTGSVFLNGRWEYDRFFRGRLPDDSQLHLNGNFTFRKGWQLGVSALVESFGYPAELYENYFVERRENGVPVDTVRFTGTPSLGNYDAVFNLLTPRFQKFSGSLFLLFGRDDNFFEWASSEILFITLDAEWRPTDQLRVNLVYNHQQYVRPDDWSTVGMRRVPRLKLEYQLSRAVFVRVVGQYDASQQDALRDDRRTNDPILLYDPATGEYARTFPSARNDVRVDWLFSYRPTPGTVFFVGYGSRLEEPLAFRFRRFDRTTDGFFVKLSYLFRV